MRWVQGGYEGGARAVKRLQGYKVGKNGMRWVQVV